MKLLNVLSIAIFSASILIFFQNCGHPEALASKSGVEANSSPLVLNNSLEVGEPINSDQIAENPPVEPTVPEPPQVPGPEPKYGFNDIVHEGKCANIEVSDALLNIKQVEVASSSGGSFEINDVDGSISLASNTVRLKALSSGEVSEIRLILNDSGNYLLSFDELVYGLKTPSGQTSGFKVKLGSSMKIEEGENYELALNIDLSRQIVMAGKKCLLKPVVRSSTLTHL